MLTELCAECRNYFLTHREEDIHTGTFAITNSSVDVDFLKDGQYFRIVGSALNDGVYQYPTDDLNDEVFSGAIWAMSVPPSFIAIAADIDALNAKIDELGLVEKGYASESFDGYSYTLASGAPASVVEWQKRIEKSLIPYRRLFVL